MLSTLLLSATVACAAVSSFVIDPKIQDPRQIWFIETESPGNDIFPAMMARGLSTAGGRAAAVNRHAKEIVVAAMLERVNDVYQRNPDGTSVRGKSFSLCFVGEQPSAKAYPNGPGYDYSQICVGTGSRVCGGILGVETLDLGNQEIEYQCAAGQLGVFAGHICGLDSTLSPRLGQKDLRYVDGSYALGDGTAGEDDRFLDIREALEDWGTAIGNVVAHEIGHSVGLEHDKRRGHVMQAAISADDLSSTDLSMSAASKRRLASDVGYALRPARSTEHQAIRRDVDATLGALARSALTIERVDAAARVEAVVHGDARAIPRGKLARDAGPGFVFFLRGAGSDELEIEFVPAPTEPELLALGARLEVLLAARGRLEVAEGLNHWLPRIATDAAIDLADAPGAPDAVEASLVEEALLRNADTLEDLRPLIRLAGRDGCAGAVPRILDLAGAPSGADLTLAAAEAIEALHARDALRERLAAQAGEAARARLTRVLIAVPSTTVCELARMLADPDAGVARQAAIALLRRGGAEGRAALRCAAATLPEPRRAMVDDLRRRPRPR